MMLNCIAAAAGGAIWPYILWRRAKSEARYHEEMSKFWFREFKAFSSKQRENVVVSEEIAA